MWNKTWPCRAAWLRTRTEKHCIRYIWFQRTLLFNKFEIIIFWAVPKQNRIPSSFWVKPRWEKLQRKQYELLSFYATASMFSLCNRWEINSKYGNKSQNYLQTIEFSITRIDTGTQDHKIWCHTIIWKSFQRHLSRIEPHDMRVVNLSTCPVGLL